MSTLNACSWNIVPVIFYAVYVIIYFSTISLVHNHKEGNLPHDACNIIEVIMSVVITEITLISYASRVSYRRTTLFDYKQNVYFILHEGRKTLLSYNTTIVVECRVGTKNGYVL